MEWSALVERLAAPAQRALATLGVASYADLARHSEREVTDLHGLGPTAVAQLKAGLASAGLRFRDARVDLIRAFLQALSDGASGAALDAFYHPEARQTEFPNLLTKAVTTRDLGQLRAASEQGKAVLRRQSYELTRVFAADEGVVIEAVWTAELAIPLGKLPAGGEMKAYFAQVYEFRDGRIIAQRNYDCFESFV